MWIVAFTVRASVQKFPTIFPHTPTTHPSFPREFSHSCHVRSERLDPFAVFRPSRILTAGKTKAECKSGLFICKSIFAMFFKLFSTSVGVKSVRVVCKIDSNTSPTFCEALRIGIGVSWRFFLSLLEFWNSYGCSAKSYWIYWIWYVHFDQTGRVSYIEKTYLWGCLLCIWKATVE